jgi:hypothetical protein
MQINIISESKSARSGMEGLKDGPLQTAAFHRRAQTIFEEMFQGNRVCAAYIAWQQAKPWVEK